MAYYLESIRLGQVFPARDVVVALDAETENCAPVGVEVNFNQLL